MAATVRAEQIRLRSSLMSLSSATSLCLVLIISLNSRPTGRITCQESSPLSRRQGEITYPFEGLQNEDLLVTNSQKENETRSDNQFGRVPHRSHRHARPPLGPIVRTYEQIVLAGSQVRLVCPHAVAHHLTPGADSFATPQTDDQQGLPNTKQQQQQQPNWRPQLATQSGSDERGETKAWNQQSSSGGSGLDSRIVSGANYNGHEQIRWFRNHVPLPNQEQQQQQGPLPAVVSSLSHEHGRQRRRNEFKLGRTTRGTAARMGHAPAHPRPHVSGQNMDEPNWPHQTDSGNLSELNQIRLPSRATNEAIGSKEIATSLQGDAAVIASDGAAAAAAAAAFRVRLHQKLETEPLGEPGKSSGENVNELTSYEQSEPAGSGESQMARSDNNNGSSGGGGEVHDTHLNIEPRLQDNWYVSKYGELVLPDVSARTAGRYTCLYAGRQSELILDVIEESSGGSEPGGVTRRSRRVVSPVVVDLEEAKQQRMVARKRTRRAEAGRARTPFWAAARSAAPKLPHFIESEIVSDQDLEVIPGLMYTKQQLYCPVASQADLQRALGQHVHWLTRNFCTFTSPTHARSRPPAQWSSDTPATLLRCTRLARQLMVRLLHLARHQDRLCSTDGPESSSPSGGRSQEYKDKFFQIVWFKDNRALDFYPDGRGTDKNINVKLINFIDQFKLSATTSSDRHNNNSSSNNNNSNASEDNENKAPGGPLPLATSSGPTRGLQQIDMSEPGVGPSSSLREQSRQRRASESTMGDQHENIQEQKQEGSLSLLDLSPPSPLENLILEIDGIRRDKAGRYTCALQFNSAKLASLLEGLKRMGSAVAAAALADNWADLHPAGIACLHGKRDKSKCCDPSAAAAAGAKVAAAQETTGQVRQIREQTQFDRGAPTKLTPLAPEIGSIGEATRPTLGAATSKATQLQSEIEVDRPALPRLRFESPAFRASQPADLGDELNAAQRGSGAKTDPMDEQLQQQQQLGTAIPVIGAIASNGGAKDGERDQQQRKTTNDLAQQISYLESILNGSISSEDSLNYIEHRIHHKAHSRPAAPVMALQTFALLISERPANSCSLWATIKEANEAYTRRKFVDFEQLKRSETFASAQVTDHSMQAKASVGVDLATNYEVEGKPTKGSGEYYADGQEGAGTPASLTADGSGSLIKDASSAKEGLANRAFNYVNERNSWKLNYPVGAPGTMARSAALAKHTMRAAQSEARIRVKTRQNGQIARWTHLEPRLSRRNHEAVTSPSDSRQMSSSNNDQLRSTGMSMKDNEISSGSDDDEELLWAASRYLYMHVRAYASSSLYGVQVDVEWSNEKQRHHLPYMNSIMEQDVMEPARMTINGDERLTLTTSRQQDGQHHTWDSSDLAPFATIDLVAGQELHLQCTAQALGRLPDVKWYKRIDSVPESLPGHLKAVLLKRSLGPNKEILYWPVTHLDLLGPADESETKFVCSQSLTIFDNLPNQTFTVISSLKLSHYMLNLSAGGGGPEPEEQSANELEVDVGSLEGSELSPSLFACMVDADVRHQEATLGVRFRQAPSGKRLPLGLRKRLRARSLMAGRQHKPLMRVPSHPHPEMLNVDQVTGITNSHESNYDFLRRDSELFVPLSRSAVWLPLDRNGTYLGDNALVALDSYGAGLMSPIMLALVIAFLTSSLVALVYLTLKSYRALTNFRQDADDDCALNSAHTSEMLQFGSGRERDGQSQSSQADTLCEFNLKNSTVKHRMITGDDVTTTRPSVFIHNHKRPPSLCASPTGEYESSTRARDIHMSGHSPIKSNSANTERLYYDAHFHDLDPDYLYQELTGVDASDPSSQEMTTTTCPPSCCPLTMAHATDDNMFELLSRAI